MIWFVVLIIAFQNVAFIIYSFRVLDRLVNNLLTSSKIRRVLRLIAEWPPIGATVVELRKGMKSTGGFLVNRKTATLFLLVEYLLRISVSYNNLNWI